MPFFLTGLTVEIDGTVQSRLIFNPIEFDGIKIGVVQLLPDAEKLDGEMQCKWGRCNGDAVRFLGFEQTAVPCLRNPLAAGD